MRRSLRFAWEGRFLHSSVLLPFLIVVLRSLHLDTERGLPPGQTPVLCAFVLHLIPVAAHVWHESPVETPQRQTKSVPQVLRSSVRCEYALRTSRTGGYA